MTRRLSQVRWAGGIALIALVLWPLPTATVGQVPSGTAPSGAAPSGAAPSGAAPSGAAPSGAGPSGAGPSVTASGLATATQQPATTTPSQPERSSRAIVASRHPWGAFRVGAWKRVRVVTETLDGDGKVLTVSTTETTSTLESVTDREIALRVASTIEIGGKSYPSPPQVLRQGFYGQAAGQVANVKKTTDSQVTINGQAIPCETFEVTVQGDDKKRVTLLQISEKHAPYVLGSATSMVKGEGQKPVALSMSEVVALNMPYKVLAETKNTAFVKTTHVRDDGRTITTLEIQAADVPGGIVAHTSKETDSQGRLVQRSTLELLDFGTESVQSVPRRRIFQRNRTRGAAAGNAGAGERP